MAASASHQASVQEALALKLAERYLRQAIPGDLLADLKQYFRRADNKLKDESLYRAWLGKVRLIPATQPLGTPDVARNVLANAYAGVLRETVLNVSYRARVGEKAKVYEIEPLAIVVRGTVTYLVAKFPWADDLNLMALHRFTAIRTTDQKITAHPDFNLDNFLDSGALGFMQTTEKRVTIRFYDGAGAHLAETPISPTQILRPVAKNSGESGLDLIATLPITEQFKWWVLGFGDRAEVIAPALLRKEIAERLSMAAQRYKK